MMPVRLYLNLFHQTYANKPTGLIATEKKKYENEIYKTDKRTHHCRVNRHGF